MRRLIKVWRRLRYLERLSVSADERRQLRDLHRTLRYLETLQGRGRLFEEHRARLEERALYLQTSLAMVEVRRALGGEQ